MFERKLIPIKLELPNLLLKQYTPLKTEEGYIKNFA